MNPVSLNLSPLDHLNRQVRTIRIEAIRAISFAHQIERDWDEICREAVEGSNHQRTGANRFKGE